MGRRDWGLLALIILAALIFRAVDWPRAHELRNVDEFAYVYGGLQLLEGMVPPYKYSPGAIQTWLVWAWGGVESAKYVFLPSPEESSASFALRPFIAVNHVLWDAYRDLSVYRWIWVAPNVAAMVLAAGMMGYLGKQIAGLPGMLLGGLVVAATPIFVLTSGEARPYAIGWAMTLLALHPMILRRDEKAQNLSAILFGLAVASRIDMLMLLPFAWSELWTARTSPRGFLCRFLAYNLRAALVAIVVAPWILTNLIGNLRIIATVRVATPIGGAVPLIETIRGIAWEQGWWLILPLAALGAVMPRAGERWPRVLLGIYSLMILLSMFKATGFGLQHQGGPLVACVLLAILGLAAVARRSASWAFWAAGIAVVLPVVQGARAVWDRHRSDSRDQAVAWVEANVPQGTRVFVRPGILNLIPSAETGDRLWAEVNDDNAWRRKVQAGMERFKLSGDSLPRALSDENMLVERGNRRGYFIHVSRPQVKLPRFAVQPFWSSPIFGTQDLRKDFAAEGGVVILRADPKQAKFEDLKPVKQWLSPNGQGVYIYASDDVKMKVPPETAQ